MKILVPTDFSACADFALDAAIKIARRTSASLSLFHASIMPEDFVGINDDSEVLSVLKKQLEKNVSALMQQRVVKVREAGLECSTHNVYGEYLSSVLAYDEAEDFDLFVVGSYGASGKQEWFIGSNTQKLVRKVRKNVMVIKNPIEKLDFDRALFPTNLTTEDEKAFKSFLSFLRMFNTREVHILAVNTSGWFTQPAPLMLELLEDFKKLAEGFECKTHFFSDYSVEAGIRHFSEDFGIKLIGISNQVRHPLKRLFQGSNVEMLVNHSDLPVLAIDGQ